MKILRLSILLSAVLVLIPCFNAWAALEPAETDEFNGKPAPGFSISTLEGKKISLEEFKGRPVLLSFFASWCPPCQKEIGELMKLREKYRPHGLEIIGAATDSKMIPETTAAKEESDVRELQEGLEIPYPITIADQKLVEAYNFKGIPTTVFINPEGKIIKVFYGYHDVEAFERILDELSSEKVGFDKERPGQLPPGWVAGVTGQGSPQWSIEKDTTAPSKDQVLKQSGSGTFPWCVKSDVSLADGYVEVKFKPLSGSEDQAGGLVWRWKNGNDYYVARANALENNVSLYYTKNGRRNTLRYVDAPVAGNTWHTLRVEFSGKRIKVALDGRQYIDMEDSHIEGAGAVGVWTKADSVTAFDDFNYGAK